MNTIHAQHNPTCDLYAYVIYDSLTLMQTGSLYELHCSSFKLLFIKSRGFAHFSWACFLSVEGKTVPHQMAIIKKTEVLWDQQRTTERKTPKFEL